jgi:electron transport complex protein RnfE
VAQGVGYTLVLIVMCVIRELLGNGTFGGGILGTDGAGIQIIPAQFPAMMMILPVGGFLTLGVLIAVVQYFLNGRKKGAGDK